MIDFIIGPYRTIVRYARLLGVTTWDMVRQRYAGSIFGLLWLALAPLILLTLYAVIYLLIYRVRPPSMGQVDYVLYMFSGLLPFLGFAQGLGMGATCLTLDKGVLLNTVFPSELLPLRSVLASQVTVVVGLSIAIVGALLVGRGSPYMLLVPVMIVLLGMFLSGLVWVLSLATLVIRDIEQVLVFITLALLIVTPIAYTPDMVPEGMKLIIYSNPLSYYVMSLQQLILLGRLPDTELLVAALLLSFLSFSGGFWIYQRAKKVMFDYA